MNSLSRKILVLIVILCLAIPSAGTTQPVQAATPISFTILHTNDFHGQLEPSGSNPGMARTAAVVNGVRSSVGSTNVLLVDAGDEMQGSLLSNLQKGKPTIDVYNAMHYDVATFGNHEFDWGQQNLLDRTGEATYPYVTANIVKGSCDASNWTRPDFADGPYQVITLASGVKVAFIGVTTTEVPTITVASATEGLCFKDPTEAILHYYDEMKANADVIVVLSHLGFSDGGYGYGIPVYGDQTLAKNLINAGKPVPLIIGGHSHTNMTSATVITVAGKSGSTTITQAYYNGRVVGREDLVFNPDTKEVTVAWTRLPVSTTGTQDPDVNALITKYTSDPDYQSLVNTPIGFSAVDLSRNYNGDAMMGDFIDDAIYNYLNSDGVDTNNVDLFFNNAGGIRADWCAKLDATDTLVWSSSATDCDSAVHDPLLLNYGNMFSILPFGNATVVGKMTGAQILEVLNQAATLGKGAIQPAGIRYSFYYYKDGNPGPQPYAWGAFDACVINKETANCDPLDMDKVYSVGTNEFLAPAGGDNYSAFKFMTDITYWGDMLDAVNAYVTATYGTPDDAYLGPNGDGTLDGRIYRDGNDTTGSIVPLTILHNNDSHGNLAKGQYVGYTQLATLIKQERAHNPTRTLLLDGGDQIQGDAMMYYFKSAPSGYAADGTALPAELQTHPMMAIMNALGYDAMTLGNHEFNFGSTVFTGIFGQAAFPVLGANVADDGRYGLAQVGTGDEGVQPYTELTVGSEGIKVGILGLTNHRVPNYELPSNIVGLTFSNPLTTAEQYVGTLDAKNDVVLALTHIGFTTNPSSVEVDTNVDTNLAAQVGGLDAIIGAHSHTNPEKPEAPYKYLPTIVGGPDNAAVLINQAYRYNNTLGEVILGLKQTADGYEVVARSGRFISVKIDVSEDKEIKDIVDPYVAQLNAYNSKVVGQTTVPIDTQNAFTEETNGANLQADAAVWELNAKGITDVDFHLSGAMTNKLMASTATPATPFTLKISDMFAGMPYENSLVVIRMNGPQLKAVLERAYRNYYYYKYVPGRGGYSYYTTCMIDVNSVGKITYNDLYPDVYDPTVNHVVKLEINGVPIDFEDASTYYNVSTVNYLAAGSCNFNDNGVSLWPLNQVVHDTQYYVRDAVIDYITAMGTVSPQIEGRLQFINDLSAPTITINAPQAKTYLHPELLTLDFSAVDVGDAGLKKITGMLDSQAVTSGQVIDLYTLSLGDHTLSVTAVDHAGNSATSSVTFTITATIQSTIDGVKRLYDEGKISRYTTYKILTDGLKSVQSSMTKKHNFAAALKLQSLILFVKGQTGKSITPDAAYALTSDMKSLIANLKLFFSAQELELFDKGGEIDPQIFLPLTITK